MPLRNVIEVPLRNGDTVRFAVELSHAQQKSPEDEINSITALTAKVAKMLSQQWVDDLNDDERAGSDCPAHTAPPDSKRREVASQPKAAAHPQQTVRQTAPQLLPTPLTEPMLLYAEPMIDVTVDAGSKGTMVVRMRRKSRFQKVFNAVARELGVPAEKLEFRDQGSLRAGSDTAAELGDVLLKVHGIDACQQTHQYSTHDPSQQLHVRVVLNAEPTVVIRVHPYDHDGIICVRSRLDAPVSSIVNVVARRLNIPLEQIVLYDGNGGGKCFRTWDTVAVADSGLDHGYNLMMLWDHGLIRG